MKTSIFLLFTLAIISSASFVNYYHKAARKGHRNEINPEFPYQTVLNVDKSIINLNYAAPIWAGYMPADSLGSLIYYHLYPANGANDSSANLNNSLPLIMWMQGGPGCTDWVGLFNENGPYTIINQNGENIPELTSINWNQGYNLLYIDQPVPVGFSVAAPGVNITNSMESAIYMETFLINFFNIYTSLKSNKFFIFGESFGGHYIPSLASVLIANGTIKVDGIAIGDGLVNPYYHAVTWAPYGLAVGVIDTQGSAYLAELGAEAQQQFNQGEWVQVSNTFNDILGYLSNTSMTGVVDIEDYRSESSDTPPYVSWVGGNPFREAYGIDPSVVYQDCDETVGSDFTDVGESYAVNVTYLLNNNIPVMIYQGQDDLLINTPGTRKWIDNLGWSGINKWLATPTKILKDNDNNVIGTYKLSGLLNFVVVNKAGHMVPHYQPLTAQIIVNNFINEKW